MEVHFRRATLADAEVIATQNAALALESENLELDRERLRRGVQTVLRDPAKGFYILAVLDGAVVGQTMITFEWSDWSNGVRWWVQSVYVRPQVRRRGIYRQLFQHLMDEAKAKGGVCGLRLYVYRENHLAQTVYQRLGFQQMNYFLYGTDFASKN